MIRLHPRIFAVAVLAVLFTGGCDAMGCFGCGGQSERRDIPLRTTQWQLVSFDDYDEAVEAAESTLRLKPDTTTFEGKAACNSYGGRYEAEGKQRLRLDVRWITEVGCELNEYEYALMAGLEKVERYEINGNTLVLHTSRNEQLQFEAQPEG